MCFSLHLLCIHLIANAPRNGTNHDKSVHIYTNPTKSQFTRETIHSRVTSTPEKQPHAKGGGLHLASSQDAKVQGKIRKENKKLFKTFQNPSFVEQKSMIHASTHCYYSAEPGCVGSETSPLCGSCEPHCAALKALSSEVPLSFVRHSN